MTKMIKVGNTTFSEKVFDGLTLKQAQEKFAHIRKDIIKEAYKQAKPKKASKKSSK